MKRAGIVFVVLFIFGMVLQPLGALEARLVSAEIYLTLGSDGKAVVQHSLVWNVSSGTMGGFYFQGEKAPFVWDMERCWADLPDGTRQPLEIKRAGDKWDILLARGKRTNGLSTWVLTYGTDLLAADMSGLTQKADGEKLFFFHWAPPEWDQALDHRTVTIILPIEVSRRESGDSRSERLADLGFATEKQVNEKNKIDWYAADGSDGKSYLAIRFHQEKPAAYASQELQFYLSASKVEAAFGPVFGALAQTGTGAASGGAARTTSASGSGANAGKGRSASPGASTQNFDWQRYPLLALFLCGGVAALGVLLYRKKVLGFPKAVAKAEGIAWAGDSWTPPRIVEGTYAVPGKVAE
ncbi:MAG TPA: hypothetical protein DHU26_03600, partial [Spirochaetaceae bacterium]|nr:hypothetical protein [Spirochaetaceae bacterium]